MAGLLQAICLHVCVCVSDSVQLCLSFPERSLKGSSTCILFIKLTRLQERVNEGKGRGRYGKRTSYDIIIFPDFLYLKRDGDTAYSLGGIFCLPLVKYCSYLVMAYPLGLAVSLALPHTILDLCTREVSVGRVENLISEQGFNLIASAFPESSESTAHRP